MPMKQLLHRLQPIQVYIVLALSVCYFIAQMFISQNSQSITLLVHAYHMLCNIIALSGCIITIKNNDNESKRLSNSSDSSTDFSEEDIQQNKVAKNPISEKKKQQNQHEKSLKNTFGWARVDVLTMVIVCTFLTSLCFSIVVEVVQTLFHVEHNDHVSHEEFHAYPYEFIIVLGGLGLVLNGISYLLIGGYTYHQGSFLHLTADGNVYILDKVVTDGRKISDSKDSKFERKSQKIHELSRDVCSGVIVIVCSTILFCLKDLQGVLIRLVDPILSLVSISILLWLSYPYMKEAASILLQTIPDSIDINDFQKKILQKFPEIQSIHDLHIWQLTQEKFVSTAHVIFMNPRAYKLIIGDVLGFFHEQGINIVTIQPEFENLVSENEPPNEEMKTITDGKCLVACRQTACEEKLCCKQEGSSESIRDCQLEQVVSIENMSAEEINSLGDDFTSAKSLNYQPDEDSSQLDIVSPKKRSSSSLYNPQTKHQQQRLQKAVSAIDREKIQSTSNSEDIHLVKIKKFVSESTIKTGEHDEQDNEILVENRMLAQLDTTDNNEMEDLYEKCDNEK